MFILQIVGCQPQQSKVMYESIRAGKIVFEESGDTLSDGTKGGVEEAAITFEPCRDCVDEWILVSEAEISDAVYLMLAEHCKVMKLYFLLFNRNCSPFLQMVEGAAGVAIAAFIQQAEKYKGKKVVIVSCGCRISPQTLYEIIAQHNKTMP
jgi:threonine dehydratase